MQQAIQGKRLYISTEDPCPACGKRTYSRVLIWHIEQGVWLLVEASCTSVQCNPAMRGSIPDMILHGEPVLFPDCIQVSLDLCHYCWQYKVISVDRGERQIALECPGCRLLYVPRFKRDAWLKDDEPHITVLDSDDLLDADDASGVRSKSPVPPADPAAKNG